MIMELTAYFESKIAEVQAHLDRKRAALQATKDAAQRAKIQHDIYGLLGQEKAYYTAWMELINRGASSEEGVLDLPEPDATLEAYLQELTEGRRPCKRCGKSLQEEEAIYCEACLVAIRTGGAAQKPDEETQDNDRYV